MGDCGSCDCGSCDCGGCDCGGVGDCDGCCDCGDCCDCDCDCCDCGNCCEGSCPSGIWCCWSSSTPSNITRRRSTETPHQTVIATQPVKTEKFTPIIEGTLADGLPSYQEAIKQEIKPPNAIPTFQPNL